MEMCMYKSKLGNYFLLWVTSFRSHYNMICIIIIIIIIINKQGIRAEHGIRLNCKIRQNCVNASMFLLLFFLFLLPPQISIVNDKYAWIMFNISIKISRTKKRTRKLLIFFYSRLNRKNIVTERGDREQTK